MTKDYLLAHLFKKKKTSHSQEVAIIAIVIFARYRAKSGIFNDIPEQTGNCCNEIPGNPLDNLSNVSLSSAWRSNVNDGARYYLLCAHSI